MKFNYFLLKEIISFFYLDYILDNTIFLSVLLLDPHTQNGTTQWDTKKKCNNYTIL